MQNYSDNAGGAAYMIDPERRLLRQTAFTSASGASGNISVTTPYGTVIKAGFVFLPPPVMIYFTPVTAAKGSTVTIYGNNFVSVRSVSFGGVPATSFRVLSPTSISAVVSDGASGPVSVESRSGTSSLAGFIFLLTPVISSFSPASGQTGTQVTITGNNLQSGSSGLSVFFGAVKATPITASNTAITLKVPAGASYQPLSVTSNLLTAYADKAFTPTFPGAGAAFVNSSFAAKTDLTSSNAPQDAFIHDFDGDGKPDIVASVNPGLFSLGMVDIYRNTGSAGNISFSAKNSVTTGVNPVGMNVADFDGDGKQDLVVGHLYVNQISTLRNISTVGNIRFADAVSIGPANIFNGFADNMTVTDIDRDGKPDLVVTTSSSNAIAVFRNASTVGSISFEPKVEYLVSGTGVKRLATGDLDGDGKPDLAVVNRSLNTVSIFKNGGTGLASFLPKVDYATAVNPLGLALGDLDGDSKPEIAVAGMGSALVSILRNRIGEPLIMPLGTSPVSGVIVNRLSIDSAVQTYNGAAYVQRHYDIEPLSNPSAATGRITLYFSQAEFDNFNAYPVHGADLPKTPDDAAGKAALRVYQYHGVSTTYMPGSYSGSSLEIDPADTGIVWNPIAQWWEISFDVTGFSGFFVSSANNRILPLQLLSFTGSLRGKTALLQWTTAREVNLRYFSLEHSFNGSDFTTVSLVQARNNLLSTTYHASDTLGTQTVCYYRLKMVDAGGSYAYSEVVTLRKENSPSGFEVFPNPAQRICTVTHPVRAGNGAHIYVSDLQGRIVKIVSISGGAGLTTLDLGGLQAGWYNIIWSDGSSRFTQKLLIK